MARDNTTARLQLALLAFDGIRPPATLEWVSAPALTQAAAGAGHRAAGRETIIRGTAGIITFTPDAVTVTCSSPPNPASPAP